MNMHQCPTTSRRAFLCHVVGSIAGMGVTVLTPREHGQASQPRERRQPRVASANPHVADVRELGAVGDGKTDDSPAFQAAVNSLSKSRGVVRLRNGRVYVIGAG